MDGLQAVAHRGDSNNVGHCEPLALRLRYSAFHTHSQRVQSRVEGSVLSLIYQLKHPQEPESIDMRKRKNCPLTKLCRVCLECSEAAVHLKQRAEADVASLDGERKAELWCDANKILCAAASAEYQSTREKARESLLNSPSFEGQNIMSKCRAPSHYLFYSVSSMEFVTQYRGAIIRSWNADSCLHQKHFFL